jgi:hypothetical protein
VTKKKLDETEASKPTPVKTIYREYVPMTEWRPPSEAARYAFSRVWDKLMARVEARIAEEQAQQTKEQEKEHETA